MTENTAADTAMKKKELRKEILAARRSMDPALAREKSERICQAVRKMDLYREAASLCVYMPIKGEVEADLLIPGAMEEGKRVYIPKVVGEEMIFNRYEEDKIRVQGRYGIRESDSAEVLEPDDKTLIVMPGAVFDLQRHRIGYGGGYYDRFLSRYPCCRTIAVGFALQIVDGFDADAHDISPEMIITENRVIR